MPWKIFRDGDRYCVHKMMADGAKGERVKCHPTQAAAKEHMAALYANMPQGEKTMMAKEIGGSIQDFLQQVRSAFERQFPPQKRPDGMMMHLLWVRDIFEDYIVVSDDEDNQLYRVAMTKGADGISFAPRPKWEKVKLTYARELVADSIITEFRGMPPEIPPRPGVDLAALTEGDDNPFFLTLEISTVGRVSKNGLVHDEELANTLVSQINSRAAEGIMGHIKETERSSAYPVSDIHWLGAVRQGNSAWAKGYIPKTAAAQREHFRIVKATNGRAATSIAGPAVREFVDKAKGIWRAKDFELEQLDLAPYTRAALPPTSDFVITHEMSYAPVTPGAEEVAEMERIEELEQQVADRDTLIAELKSQVEAAQKERFQAALDAKIAELVNWQVSGDEAVNKVTALKRTLRARMLAELGAEQKVERIEEIAKSVWADMQVLAETMRDALAGPPALVGGKQRGRRELVDTPETRAQARALFGI